MQPSAPATRRTIVVGLGALVAGCLDDGMDESTTSEDDGTDGSSATDGDDGNASENGVDPIGEVEQVGDLTLTSPAFDDGDRIPEQYGYEAENVNPPLSIESVPDDADSLALIVDDPDAVEPAGEVWTHWLVWNVPPDTTSIPEDWDVEDAVEGTNDFDEVGYDGPDPPDAEHRYWFKLFALETTLDLSPDTDADGLAEAVDGHVIAATQLDGTYPA